MAKRKKTIQEEIENFVSEKEAITEDIIQPHVVEYYRERVLDLRGKGYNDNQIAGMLMIHKQKVENIK
jgi:hypothetical protein